ncbi:MAG TPA: ABC transporter permease [Sedimenticola sp.]|nr:ABC transporter permease [Sedimenticola sp.]
MPWHIIALAIKEFLALLRDKRSRIVLIGPPIAQLIVFGYAATFDLNNVPVAIYNEDPGGVSRAFVSRIEGSPHFQVVARIHRDAEIAPLIDDKEALLVLHIGQRFSADLNRGVSAPVQAILDGRNSNTALIALNYLHSILLDFNLEQAARQGRSGAPAVLEMRAWYNENLRSRWFIVPGIVGLLTLVVTLIVTALSVAREREQGTFDQLLVTPLRPVEILIGKAVPGIVIGIFEASFIILLSVYWFDIPLRGSLGALYVGLFCFLLSAVGIGLMISAIAVTQQQAVLGAFLFLVPAVILSGFATPIANMPDAVQTITYINPMRYFLIVVRGVFLEGDSYLLLWDQYWPMLLIGLASLSLAGWLFRHRMY